MLAELVQDEFVFDFADAKDLRSAAGVHLLDHGRELSQLPVEQGLGPSLEVLRHGLGQPRFTAGMFGRGKEILEIPESDRVLRRGSDVELMWWTNVDQEHGQGEGEGGGVLLLSWKLALLNLDHLQGDARDDLLFDADVNGVLARGRELQTLQVEDQVLAHEKHVVGEFDIDRSGRQFGQLVLSVSIDHGELELVFAFVHFAHENSQRDRTVRMDRRDILHQDGVESAEHAQLPVVVAGRIAKARNLYFHKGEQYLSGRGQASKKPAQHPCRSVEFG